MSPDEPVIDPVLGLPATVQFVHPFQALKQYQCPGCNHAIMPRTGHFVVVPTEAADLRRHWHKSCWENRARRKPARG